MTLDDLAALEALWADANQDTPWQTFEAKDGTEGVIHLCDDDGAPLAWLPADDAGRCNGRLIVTAVNALPALLALARRGLEAGGGVAEIAAERRRQVEDEGWSPTHDRLEHDDGALAKAAGSYALMTALSHETRSEFPPGTPPAWWPWDAGWWKPKDRRRDLIRAGALIVAEIERLDRAAAREQAP